MGLNEIFYIIGSKLVIEVKYKCKGNFAEIVTSPWSWAVFYLVGTHINWLLTINTLAEFLNLLIFICTCI